MLRYLEILPINKQNRRKINQNHYKSMYEICKIKAKSQKRVFMEKKLEMQMLHENQKMQFLQEEL